MKWFFFIYYNVVVFDLFIHPTVVVFVLTTDNSYLYFGDADTDTGDDDDVSAQTNIVFL